MEPPPLRTTRLENLHFGTDGARFDLDGQTVNLRTEADPASVAALRTFHQSALAGYEAREAPPKGPGWLSRLRSWIGRLFGGSPDRTAEAEPAPAAHPQPAAARRVAALPFRDPDSGPLPPAPESPPVLRAAFADPQGVHLLWQESRGGRPGPAVDLRYDLDSEVGRRLQDCYGHLEKLGYKVVGIDLMRARAEGPRPGREEAEPEKTPGRERQPVTDSGKGPAAGKDPSPEKREPTLVVRLHPVLLEQPNRALVSPVETEENNRIVVAPERLVRALHAAAGPERPPAERLTYLRCAVGRGGLKVVDVGLGEGRDRQPERWEDVSAWFSRQAEAAPAAGKAPTPAAPGPDLQLNL